MKVESAGETVRPKGEPSGKSTERVFAGDMGGREEAFTESPPELSHLLEQLRKADQALKAQIAERKRIEACQAVQSAVTRILSACKHIHDAGPELLRVMCEGLSWDCGEIWFMDAAPDSSRLKRMWRVPAAAAGDEVAFRIGDGVLEKVFSAGEPVWLNGVLQSAPADEGFRSACAFPIRSGKEVLGVAAFFSQNARERDDTVIAALADIGCRIGQFLEHTRTAEALMASEERFRSLAKQLEDQLIISDRLVSLGEIAASIAHEFNNPLTVILGFAQDLLTELEESHPHYRPIRIIEEEARRCKKIIQDFSDLARPTAADFSFIDIGEVVRTSINIVSFQLQKQEIKTVVAIEPSLPQIYADRRQLEQVLLNLYFNAMEAMPGGGTLAVRVARKSQAFGRSQELIVEVSDTGIGIAPRDFAKIFRPFFTTKKKSGMGLGLSICRRIIAAHGGRIEVDSEPGRGATFTICLPLSRAGAEV
ncbi:MAG TPA: ATP-binding protein [Candidatus Acidoferrales bacterium]|nr:ATP-binding protein [Candidatus Acidoferrales bacterium]